MDSEKWKRGPNQSMEQFVKTIYSDIEMEIYTLGWSKIIEKYHPDNNLDDPRALEVFNIYKHVYNHMQTKAKALYARNKSYYDNNKSLKNKIENETIKNYETIINRFYYLSITMFIFIAIMLIIKVV